MLTAYSHEPGLKMIRCYLVDHPLDLRGALLLRKSLPLARFPRSLDSRRLSSICTVHWVALKAGTRRRGHGGRDSVGPSGAVGAEIGWG